MAACYYEKALRKTKCEHCGSEIKKGEIYLKVVFRIRRAPCSFNFKDKEHAKKWFNSILGQANKKRDI